jgi:hypothetical protein
MLLGDAGLETKVETERLWNERGRTTAVGTAV